MVQAIRTGDVDQLRPLLDADITTVRAVIVDEKGVGRTLLHVATDWPGHFPRVAETIRALIAAGAALDALLDGGADIEAAGAAFTGGAPMSDAVTFAQWNAARRLLERGANTTLVQAAALGLLDRVREGFVGGPPPREDITKALWHACRGGQLATSMFLLEHGGDASWKGWEALTPIDVAQTSGNAELVQRLRAARQRRSVHQLQPELNDPR